MKRFFSLLLAGIFLVCCCAGCRTYTPKGEFYAKTLAHNGDADVERVISLEAERLSYEGEGDIAVPMTVGFGHLPEEDGYGTEGNTFYLTYKVYRSPWKRDNEPLWEKKVEYADSYFGEKYDSTARNHSPLWYLVDYGEFYPLYKEDVEIVFPAGISNGYFEVELYHVFEGEEVHQYGGGLLCYFTRANGVLTLKPGN